MDPERQGDNIQEEADEEINSQQDNQVDNPGFTGSDVSLPSVNPSSQDYAFISEESGSNTTAEQEMKCRLGVNTVHCVKQRSVHGPKVPCRCRLHT